MSLNEKMTAIANTIRAHTGSQQPLSLDDMPAEISLAGMNMFDRGYTEGHAQGKYEGKREGQQAEYDAFWDTFQNEGKNLDYRYAFAYGKWTDENYNPKYPIEQNGDAYTKYMFTLSAITNTKVDIKILNSTKSNTSVFAASALETIPKLILGGNEAFSGWFTQAYALKNIVIGGSIDVTLNLNHSPLLTQESVVSIIEHLSGVTTGQTLTLLKTTVDNMMFPYAYKEITYDSWDDLIAIKPNWTITLV